MGESRNPSDPVSFCLSNPCNSFPLSLRIRVKSKSLFSTIKEKKDSKEEPEHKFGEFDDISGLDTLLWKSEQNRLLYIFITPKQIYKGASKEAFVKLLDCAEEDLKCNHVIVCLKVDNVVKEEEEKRKRASVCPNKDESPNNIGIEEDVKKEESKKHMNMAIRNFLFLGFEPIASGDEFAYPSSNILSFIYNI